MARQLEAQGEAVEAVLLVDSATPAMVGEVLATIPDRRPAGLPGHPASGEPLDLAGPGQRGRWRDRDPEGRLRAVYERIKGLGALPPDVDEAWLRRYVRLWTARMGGLRGYAPGPGAYGGRVVFCRAGTAVPGAPAPEESRPASGGWEALCREAVEEYTAPGTHHTLVQEPCVAHLAALIEDALTPRP